MTVTFNLANFKKNYQKKYYLKYNLAEKLFKGKCRKALYIYVELFVGM
jgi:hypothetical protein